MYFRNIGFILSTGIGLGTAMGAATGQIPFWVSLGPASGFLAVYLIGWYKRRKSNHT